MADALKPLINLSWKVLPVSAVISPTSGREFKFRIFMGLAFLFMGTLPDIYHNQKLVLPQFTDKITGIRDFDSRVRKAMHFRYQWSLLLIASVGHELHINCMIRNYPLP